MSEQPKPHPPATRAPFDYTVLGLFTIMRCESCDWMLAGYGVSRAHALWETHADERECIAYRMDVVTS
jgi:hypothetical protein